MVFEPSHDRYRNPYSQMTPIRNAEMFFGRRDALEHVCSAIMDGQSVAIIGDRRIGKSSLLACAGLPVLQHSVGCDLSQHLLIYLDLEEHLQRVPDSFFAFVSEQMIQQSREKLHLSLPQGSGVDQFSQLLSEITRHNVHPVLVLDEFDSIVRNQQFNPDFFSFLRAQANAGKVSYVTASFATLDQVCHSGIVGSPFFNIFSHHSLGPLTKDATLDLITRPSANAGCAFTETEVQFVLEQAGHHPFFIQRVCYFLFKQKIQSAEKLDLKRIANQAYQDLLPHFIYVWEHSQTEQYELLKREAARQHAPCRKLPELTESALFRKFVRDKTKLTLGELHVDYLLNVLNKLDDLAFLGECDLSNLNLILSQEPHETLTLVERGMHVYKSLQDALTQLRPTTPYSELIPEWQTYNLLNICFFKKDRRSNQQLAGYLSMSERDFYRKRASAVSTLLNVILRMEISCIHELET